MNLTQRELGEKVGLTGMMIGHLETGRRRLGYDQICDLARVFGVYPADILNHEDHSIVLNLEELSLIADYRALDARGQRIVRLVTEIELTYIRG